ncbi:MAG: hypothetical protein AABZ53_13400 [Planctomycetota bacterium]
MPTSEVLPGLDDPSPGFICKALRTKGPEVHYRVPLVHRTLAAANTNSPDVEAGLAALAALPDLPSIRQLREVLHNGVGLGLWVSRRLTERHEQLEPETQEYQALAGAVLIYPPHEWSMLRDEMKDWFFDGVDQAFEGLPYGFDDILPFAGINFTPDRWYIVLRGEMAGSICWWTHDGDSEMSEPWAADLKAWGERVWEELPDVLGGIIRYASTDSIDAAPEGSELYPIKYLRDMGT